MASTGDELEVDSSRSRDSRRKRFSTGMGSSAAAGSSRRSGLNSPLQAGANPAPATPPAWLADFMASQRSMQSDIAGLTSSINQRFERVETAIGTLEQATAKTSDRMQVIEREIAELREQPVSVATSSVAGDDVGSVSGVSGVRQRGDRLEAEIRGFHSNSLGDIIDKTVSREYKEALDKLKDPIRDRYVPGRRSTRQIIVFEAERYTWAFVKYANRIKPLVDAQVLGGGDTRKTQRLYAAIRETPEEAQGSTAMKKAVRAFHESSSGKLQAHVETFTRYPRNGKPGTIHLHDRAQNADFEICKVTGSEIQWAYAELEKFGISQGAVNGALDSLSG